MASYTYRLPWPPSVNTYWRRGGNCTYLTKKAREFRRQSVHACEFVYDGFTPIGGRVAIQIELTPPDRRRRDLDNHVKAVLDALQHANVIEDDEQIDHLVVKRLQVESPGCCDVVVTEIE